MRRLLQWLVILGVVGCLVAAGGFYGQRYLLQKSKPRFTTAKVDAGKIETVVNSTGPIKPVQTVSVGSFVSGPIKEILVDYNEVVKEKQVLARIDPRLLKAAFDRENAALATQKAELARIEAQHKLAVANEKRALDLQKINKDYISEQELDQLKFNKLALAAQIDLAKANIQAAEAGVENAKTNLGFTDILSPVNGIVIERMVEPGQTLASMFQTPVLFTIAPDLDTMHVYAAVDEADIGQIVTAQRQGRPVKFTVDSWPEEVFTGKIHQVRMNATTTQNVVTYPVIISAPNPGLKLRPQMTANISFQVDVREKVTRVPTSALRFVPTENLIHPEDKTYITPVAKKDPKEGDEKLSAERRAEQAKARAKRVVWIKDGDSKVKAVPITIGLMDGQYAELVSGDLKPGDELVTGLEGEDPRARR